MRPVTQDPARGIGRRVAHDPGDPLITSHCPFCGSGQVVGRSDGTIGCDFCGQAYIVRVQPSFPGMPQPPGGPGAPSDVGPDGGLMDPSMIGPDGMPADGGMPPGDDGEDGGFPPEDDAEGGPGGEGSDSAPPPSGGSDDSKKSPKGKGGKGKKESAIYRGLQGQPLTERQFVRHLAAHASGHDPRVLAALRGESSKARFLAKMGSMPRLGQGDYPWYEPEIGRHFTNFPDGYHAVMEHGKATDDRQDAVRRNVARHFGISRMTPSGGGAGGFRTEDGHHVMVNLDYPSSTWYAALSTPGYPRDKKYATYYLHLGQDDSKVPDMLHHRLSHPDVQSLMAQHGPEPEDEDVWGQRRGPEEW